MQYDPTYAFAAALALTCAAPSFGQVNPRPLMEVVFEAGEPGSDCAGAVQRLLTNPREGPKINDAWQDVLQNDPMHFDVFTNDASLT